MLRPYIYISTFAIDLFALRQMHPKNIARVATAHPYQKTQKLSS
jgi:hypothetical protein